jgi:ABC-type multidrug transport system permease subunit
MIFLSGTFYPVEKMPLVVKMIAQVFPLTYTTKLIRGSILDQQIPYGLYFGICFVIAMVLFFLCMKVVDGVEP